MVTTTASSSSTNLTNTLGAGSGIDIKTLAQSLVDAEKAPRKAAIDKGVSNSEKVVSGMAAVKYALTNLQAAFDNLKDKSDFKTLSLSNSQPSAFTATASTAADAGSHTVLIGALAAAQRNTGTTAFAATSTAINGGAAITLTLGGTGFSGGDTITVAAGNDTPAGVVAAINGAGKGLSAQLVNTGDATSPYKVVVTGSTGSSNAFTISSSAAGINFDSALQLASNASLTVNGIAISSKSNTLSEAIPGVTLNLLATNTSAASLNLRNDTSGAKTKVLALVTAYNDAMTMLDELTNPKSTLETYGATLSGNSTVTNLRSQLRALVTADSSTAASSGTLAALRDIGVEVDKTGKLTSNSVKLDLALDLNFANTTTLLSGNQENQSSFDLTASGLAGDASKAISQLIGKSGSIATESANATTRISKYKDDLVKLEDRMTRVLARYNKQFATMDSMVGQTKSTQTGLTSSFAGLMAMYTNK
jgi:flagellar hook-associated protein 2